MNYKILNKKIKTFKIHSYEEKSDLETTLRIQFSSLNHFYKLKDQIKVTYYINSISNLLINENLKEITYLEDYNIPKLIEDLLLDIEYKSFISQIFKLIQNLTAQNDNITNFLFIDNEIIDILIKYFIFEQKQIIFLLLKIFKNIFLNNLKNIHLIIISKLQLNHLKIYSNDFLFDCLYIIIGITNYSLKEEQIIIILQIVSDYFISKNSEIIELISNILFNLIKNELKFKTILDFSILTFLELNLTKYQLNELTFQYNLKSIEFLIIRFNIDINLKNIIYLFLNNSESISCYSANILISFLEKKKLIEINRDDFLKIFIYYENGSFQTRFILNQFICKLFQSNPNYYIYICLELFNNLTVFHIFYEFYVLNIEDSSLFILEIINLMYQTSLKICKSELFLRLLFQVFSETDFCNDSGLLLFTSENFIQKIQ